MIFDLFLRVAHSIPNEMFTVHRGVNLNAYDIIPFIIKGIKNKNLLFLLLTFTNYYKYKKKN